MEICNLYVISLHFWNVTHILWSPPIDGHATSFQVFRPLPAPLRVWASRRWSWRRLQSSCWDYHICKESQPKPLFCDWATGCGVDPNYEGCLLTLHASYSFWYDVFSCWVYSKPIHNQVSEFCTSFGPLGRFGILFDAGVLVPCNVFFPKLCPSRVITLLFPSDAVYSHNFEIPVFQHV